MTALRTLLPVLTLTLPLSTLAQTGEPAKPAETPPAASAKPAAAPEAPRLVTIYGTLNVNFQTTKQQGVSSRLAVSTDSTNIGVRGSLGLSRKWLSATYQCETSAAFDGINPAGICGRNSRVGLSGPWGTLFYGNWDTPFKAVAYGTKADDPFLNTDVYGYQGIMGSPGFNYRSSAWVTGTSTPIGGFDVRASNSVAYWSPKLMGLSAKVQYSANEFESDNGVLSPQLYGAALNFDWGPLSVLAAFEFHEDAYALALANPAAVGSAPRQAAFGSTAANSSAISSKDWAWRVGAGYQIVTPAGATTVGALFEQLTLGQETAAAGAVTEFKRWAAQGSLKHRITDHELRARFNVADAGDCTLAGGGACSTDGYDAQMLSVGYAYHFAPSTQAYVSFTKIWNEQNAQYTFSIGGAPAVAGATRRNGDPQALGVGIRHAL